jgi:hypothetical protein
MKTDVMIPVSYNDCFKLRDNINEIRKYFDTDKIVVVGCGKIRAAIPEVWKRDVVFLDEDELLSLSDVSSYFYDMVGAKSCHYKPTWYYQQFLKLCYAKVSTQEYYLVWDADTALVKPHSFFDPQTSLPFFDMKGEYHPPYFETINRLFPDVNKIAGDSFISEHMVFKKQYVLEMMAEIEKNQTVAGTLFWEKILNAATAENLKSTPAFSEFETYGSWVLTRHPGTYAMRQWTSMRNGIDYYPTMKKALKDRRFLAKEFDAVSLEYGHSKQQYVMSPMSILFWNPLFKTIWKPTYLTHFLHDRGLAYWPGEKEAYRTSRK